MAEVSETTQAESQPPEPPPASPRGAGAWSIGKMEDWLPTVQVTLASVLLALVIGALLIIVSTPGVLGSYAYFFSYPWDALRLSFDAVVGSYSALLTGAVGSGGAITNTLEQSAPLICAGLGVTLAFRAGLFNIGAQGQLIIGATCAGFVGFHYDLPVGVHVVAALAAGLAGGAAWGGIAGVLKARTGAHEAIVTIMLNYVAAQVLAWLLSRTVFKVHGSSNPVSPPVDRSATFPHLFGVHAGVLLAVGAAVGLSWLLRRTTLGFSLRAVGANPYAARTAGMSVAASYTMAMTLAGLLAGLAGAQAVLGHHDQLTSTFGGTIGFDAITVSLLGRATPLGTVLAGLLFGALASGGTEMQAVAGTSVSLTEILQALIVLFVAAPMMVRALFRMPGSGAQGAVVAKGWNS